ncbi:hypothetical protein IU459_30550 [Nocardia amamiensis]|uniref:DUF5753 domain-containing protein n=1 Tax=Nocardia amamiensis TaxID=404578 RepID=A0ABS0CZ19_9NOCA|nr:Scr1 family TA system antitoxin-like transcriptional regulator [Nocardia amamiensis]MBF6301853.1 hypothetical protein [Nocardia amamiensis]
MTNLLGIVRADAEWITPTTDFVMFDERMVLVEAVTAELIITQPREIALYGRAFDILAKQAVTGRQARDLISAALDRRAESA